MIKSISAGPVASDGKGHSTMFITIPDDYASKTYWIGPVRGATVAWVEIGGHRVKLEKDQSLLIANGRIVPPKSELDERLRRLGAALASKASSNLNRA